MSDLPNWATAMGLLTPSMISAIASNDDRIQPIFSVIGFSIRPIANLEPPLKNITTDPAVNITQL